MKVYLDDDMDSNALILSKPRLLRRAQLNGVSKGGEHPLWSRAGFEPRSRIHLIWPIAEGGT